MRMILGLLVVLIVSGSQCRAADWPISDSIPGDFGESVRLPCPCSERNVGKDVGWQMEHPTRMAVLTYTNGNLEDYDNRYRGRTEIFLQANSSDCSLRLNNITTEDRGIYRCSFYIKETYKKSFVQLNITAAYSVCLKETPANVFQCEASGAYQHAEIQWRLDGQLLPNSPPTSITLNDTTGLYHFTSITRVSGTAKLSCAIKATNLSATFTSGCESKSPRLQPPVSSSYGFLTLIPIMAVFGFGLIFLWHRRRFSRRLPKTREAETDNLYC